jgi:hypothetical protein
MNKNSCGVTGQPPRRVAICHSVRHFFHKIQHNFFLVSLASLVWLILRTGTKPSRIAYPCQRAAAANVGALAGDLLALLGADKCRIPFRNLTKRKVLADVLVIASAFGALAIADLVITRHSVAGSWAAYYQKTRNVPIGKRKAATTGAAYTTIPAAYLLPSPHRVISVHDSKASSWTGAGNPANSMNQTEIDSMIERGVMDLTGEVTPQAAWQKLIPYQSGEGVAIKLNFNNVAGCDFTRDANMNAYAAVANSVIRGLKSIGVPSDKIWITDPSRPINDAFRNDITDANVHYYTKCTAVEIGSRPNVFTTGYVPETSPDATLLNPAYGVTDPDRYVRPAQVFADAAHIINIPQLKGHGFLSEVGGVTLGIKNQFGSVSFTSDAEGVDPLHSNSSFYKILADISANPVFYNKTRLVIGDGLMGNPTINWQDPVLWSTFGNQPPRIFFFGTDPVAVDSVMFDYIQRECAAKSLPARDDKVNHYAASIGLGVSEHWNNDTNRQYSTIDYREIDFDAMAAAAAPTFTPLPGTYNSPQSVTLSDVTPGATIHYTTDGSTPSRSSPVYGGPITVSVSTTIQAIAVARGYLNSSVAVGAYTVAGAPDFTASANPTSLSIKAGSSGQTKLSITPVNGFNQAVIFACSGLPSQTTCNFNPPNVTSNGAVMSTILTIQTKAGSAALALYPFSHSMTLSYGVFIAIFGGLAGLVWMRTSHFRQNARLFVCAALLLLSASTTACGGSSIGSNGGGSPGTPVGASTVTVTASTAGSVTITHQVQIVVNITQ